MMFTEISHKSFDDLFYSPTMSITMSFNHDFTTKNGHKVSIEIDEFGEEILVTGAQGQEIGSIEFSSIDDGDSEYFRIVSMFLDKNGSSYVRQGLGRECLKQHIAIFNTPIVAADDDGIRKNDGSHLTGDAPGFISQMRKEGLVAPLPHEDDDVDDC
jgi:hypothetical protein